MSPYLSITFSRVRLVLVFVSLVLKNAPGLCPCGFQKCTWSLSLSLGFSKMHLVFVFVVFKNAPGEQDVVDAVLIGNSCHLHVLPFSS